VQLVDEDDVATLCRGELFHYRLEPLLELAAVLGSREQQPDVQSDYFLVAERFRHVAADDALGQAFHDRRLAHARLADQHRVVLGSAREHLHHAPDLLVPPDYRIQFPDPCLGGEVAGEALQRLVFLFGSLVGDPVRAAYRRQRLAQILGGEPEGAEQRPRRSALLLDQTDQQVLGGDVRVPQLLCFLLGAVENLVELPAVSLGRSAPLLSRELGDFPIAGFPQRRDVEPRLLKQGLHHTLVLREQGGEEVGIVDDRIAPLGRDGGRVAEGFLGFDGQTLWSNHRTWAMGYWAMGYGL